MALTNEIIKEHLAQRFAAQIVGFEESFGMLAVVVQAAACKQLLAFLHDEEAMQFRFLTDITAVHYPDRKGEELCVVYHLHNLTANLRLRIKAYLPIAQPDIASVQPLFAGADWMERETYDFFGVNFIGHPNLVRILNVPEMDYFPLRKEYPMEDPTRRDKDDAMFGR
jgi:NADH-quinone oxidoreductase subunit C